MMIADSMINIKLLVLINKAFNSYISLKFPYTPSILKVKDIHHAQYVFDVHTL